MKRRCELMLPWLVLHSIICILTGMGLFVTYMYRNQYFDDLFGDGYSVCKYSAIYTYFRYIKHYAVILHQCNCILSIFFFVCLFMRVCMCDLIFYFFQGLFAAVVFFTNIFLWYVVRAYYESLKMMKRLTEEVVVPIPCPAVRITD